MHYVCCMYDSFHFMVGGMSTKLNNSHRPTGMKYRGSRGVRWLHMAFRIFDLTWYKTTEWE